MKSKSPLEFNSHFNITEEEIRKILNAALLQGGDFSEIYLEYKTFNFINMEEDIIKETAESISLGMGIRVLSGDRTGYGYTNDLSFSKMKKAAITASSISQKNHPIRASNILDIRPQNPNYYPVSKPAQDTDLKKKIELVKKVYLSAQNTHAAIKKVKVSYMDQIQHIVVINSDGLVTSDVRPLLKCTCLAIAEKSNLREAGFSGGGGRVGMEYFQNQLLPETIGTEAAQEALHLLEAAPSPAGEMPVVLAPGHSGVLIHEAVGHLLEADFIRKKTSIFWDKFGKNVASPQVNIYDDPTIPHFRGTYNIDDEGTAPKKTVLIQEGKLTGMLQDRLSSTLLKKPLTGHARRQDYSCIPIPRMSNTYIDKGNENPEDIIKSVDKGFYAHKFQGGQVEDSGKFTFSVSSGFLIEKGKLTRPVKQATLIGTNIDILNKIEMVGHDLKFGLQTGTCGKDGQSAPVSDGCPTLKISAMTVGGQK
ncbi:MAG: TldD/PmbA family protein [Candidatus Aminicenantes bacterium]|nr:TldD/PmbA family protein [Candidatus Aminicenantes bacterium]